MSDSPSTHPLARPFLKWAGGKTQLLTQFANLLPAELREGTLTTYVEPFVGSGALFLYIVQTYPIKRVFLSDVNEELILAWRTIQADPEALIELLSHYHTRYQTSDEEGRQRLFYQVRDEYNQQRLRFNYETFSDGWLERTAWLIFLNKTCFNGLFRLNAKGEYNVPFGRYKNPAILDAENLRRVSSLLSGVKLCPGPFTKCDRFVDDQTFVYFDPPYRPLSSTARFTSYAKERFTDQDQAKLASFFAQLDRDTCAKLMLSNSDPRNANPDDDFFDRLYRGFHLHKVQANRMINSKAEKRGKITELVITNY